MMMMTAGVVVQLPTAALIRFTLVPHSLSSTCILMAHRSRFTPTNALSLTASAMMSYTAAL